MMDRYTSDMEPMMSKNLPNINRSTEHRHWGDHPTEAQDEEFFLLMSLALDDLLDDEQQATFSGYLNHFSTFASLWAEWQQLHHQMCAMPHAMPTPNFVGRFEVRLAQQERRRRLRQGMWIGLVTLILWVSASAGILAVGTYLFVNQSALLAEAVQSVIYFWAAVVAWFDGLATTVNTFAATPQAVGLGIGYLILTVGLLTGWIQYLRRSTQLVEVPVEANSRLSVA